MPVFGVGLTLLLFAVRPSIQALYGAAIVPVRRGWSIGQRWSNGTSPRRPPRNPSS